jgi:hypothetical protein
VGTPDVVRFEGLAACAGVVSSAEGRPWLRNAAPTLTPEGGGVGAGERTVGEGSIL